MPKIVRYSKINFQKSGSGSVSGRATIPKEFLELLDIRQDERYIKITYEDGKIIIEKDIDKSLCI